ncbi:hypothetical protein LTR17_024033 [Elasticomyces elasticus]|nr:hypothetical protein LTR17_024033 [Elasticomyces elasticus]
MATIYSLPAPLPLHIAKLAPDLKALDALRQTCGLFAEIFDQHAVELLEYVMVRTLHSETVIEMRMHVLCLADGNLWRNTNDALDQLRNQAATPLHSDVSVRAIGTTLRTFSCLHSLCFRVATEKLDELYALPHRHTTLSFNSRPDFGGDFNEPYEVPAPSPPHWLEEQRMLRPLFHLRTRKLLGHGRVAPIAAPEDGLFSNEANPVYEFQCFFGRYLEAVMGGRIAPATDWHAPATISPPRSALGSHGPDEFHRGQGLWAFHDELMLRRAPFLKQDWIVFQELGLGIWSDERLVHELEMVGFIMYMHTWWALGEARILARRECPKGWGIKQKSMT